MKNNPGFMNKAKDIFSNQPQSIKDLLDGTYEKNTDGSNQLAEAPQPSMAKQYTRIHIHIRQDLANMVLDVVVQRKKDPKFSKREASQRAIIEEALEHYFKSISLI
jgi:hypothetical protein